MRILEQLIRIRSFVVATVTVLAATLCSQWILGQRSLANATLCLEPILILAWTAAWRVYRRGMIAGFDSFEERPSAGPPRELSEPLIPLRTVLLRLGFHAVAELEFRFPWQGWRHGSVFVDREATVAAVIGADPGVGYTTYWPDGSLVTTRSMPRRDVDLPMVRQLTLRASAADVYRRHVRECLSFGGAHGRPVRLTSVGDVVSSDAAARPHVKDAFRAWTTRSSATFTEVAVGGLAIGSLLFQFASGF